MSDVMRAFESVIPIEWDNDLKVVGPQATADLERSVLGILEAAAKQLPDEVTALVIRELERTAGSALDRSLLPGVAKAIEGLFVHQLWRANDKASYERLKDSLFFILKSQARLDLTAD
jgi:hypothetical protein